MLKSEIVCRGAKIAFSWNCRDVKNELFETKMAFFVFAFFSCWRKAKRKEEKTKRRKTAKNTQNNRVLGGWVGKKGLL